MPTERTMPDAGVPRYLDILFERSDQLPESYFVSMEIDGMYLGEGGFVVMLLEPSMGASAPEYLDICQRLIRQLHRKESMRLKKHFRSWRLLWTISGKNHWFMRWAEPPW